MGCAEDLGELLEVFWRGSRLSVEERCYGDFGASELFGDCLEGETFCGLGLEECLAVSWDTVLNGALGTRVSTASFVQNNTCGLHRE